ncbi:MAG: DUF6383 domain-containing protein [Tannerellaceae bacterium]|jgi:hypothetical protein|nr:DUF6383 domain-containing protein [Tannerellaceae bacterium]
MNKKFFTLIAGALMLVASFGTVSAQISPANAKEQDPLTAERQAKNLYHLVGETTSTVGSFYYLQVDNEGYIRATLDNEAKLGNSLWCISVTDREDQGLGPTYTFTNKGGEGGGGILAVSVDDLDLKLPSSNTASDSINVMNGNLTRWDFSRTYKATSLEEQRPLVLYSGTDDEVLTFVLRENTDGSPVVGVQSFPAKTKFEWGGTGQDSVIFFTVYKPAEKILTADEFNTVINTQKEGFIGLQFHPAPSIPSEFQDAIKAISVHPDRFDATADGPGPWLKFFKKTSTGDSTYLRVDTAYTGDFGVKFLKFAYGNLPDTGVLATVQQAAIEKQYYFQARYNVMNDSLAIDVMQAISPYESYAGNWYQYHKTRWNTQFGGSSFGKDSLHVKLQDLVSGQVSLLTIGTKEVSTRIAFGLKGCEAPVIDLTSIRENLYTITDSRGYYLIVPIYTDTVQGSNLAPTWVKLAENVDPNEIPAYQWVVEKTRNTNLETSPIRITNREFYQSLPGGPGGKTIQHLSLQLRENEFATLFGGDVKATNEYFHEVPLKQKKDQYLGYKNITQEDARFNTYVFNYLHAFDASQFLDVAKIGTDTSLYVAKSRTQFEIVPFSKANGSTNETRYGYWTDKIPDLAKLVKKSYIIRVKDASRLTNSGKTLLLNKAEHRYVVGKDVAAEDTAVFLLKTNNTKDGVNYYALVDTGSFGYSNSPLSRKDVIKVGIDDNSLWAYEQVQKETRTSAFAILQWTEPLYRRFDGETYGSREVKEIFGTTDNAPQWLRFTKQNNWENEFLFENSPRGTGSPDPNKPGTNDYRDDLTAWGKANISFLGLYNINQYKEVDGRLSYTLYVDTAFVKRKSSGASAADSREYTPKPQYMLAVRPHIITGDTIFKIRKDSVWDSTGKVLESTTSKIDTILRPSFTRAFYVFNAQDSIGRFDTDNNDPRKADYVGKFAYGAEYTTRLAFVDGVHMGDTFYVLRNNPDMNDIDSAYLLTGVHRADKHYLGANTHYKPRWNRNGNPSWGANDAYTDAYNGKSMVFQFRLIDPEGTSDPKNAQSRAFLIESRNNEGAYGQPTEEMGPQLGRWIKIQNNVPVVSQAVDIVEAQQNGAEIFNVVEGVEDEKKVVGNENTPAVSSVQVIGETGAVTILNANGKKVAISNILGQTVTSQTISSSNVTLPLPKGIVVVAVEGEAAVKAIVK